MILLKMTTVFSAHKLKTVASNSPAMALGACFATLPITDATSVPSLFSSTLSESSLRRRAAGSTSRTRRPRIDGSASVSRHQRRSRQDCNAAEELAVVARQSRRSVLQTGATLALLAVFDRLPALAEPPAQIAPDANDDANSTSASQEASASGSTATVRNPKKPPVVDTETWYRYRGEGFRMTIPPDYEDIVEYDESGTSLYGERAKEKPFAARFASPDRKEVLSVVVRNGSQMKLSFLQTQDITEFGSLQEAAKVFVPAGSKIVAAAALKPKDSRVPRTYYLYEFLAKDDKRVVMSAAAAGGRVFVFGAMAPNSRWKEVGSRMRSAAVNFALP